MIPGFPLNIFPHQALDNSIITPILIGLIVLLGFNEFLGWVFAGYIVPGYMAVILLTFPESAMAILIEAVITHILVVTISDVMAGWRTWSRFFGRERFLLYVLVSILVRLLMEGLVFPRTSGVMVYILGINPHDQFFSIGLVLMPLLANSFWKTGLSRGIFEKGIVILITYLIIAKLLVPYTNLNLSSFRLTYENLAMDFTAAPKVYIILLVGAVIAAAFNITFGWDFNGIMVPTLMAIALFTPVKFMSTLVEAMLAALLFAGIRRIPVLKNLTLERGRMITTVFFITFVMKWGFASVFPSYPGMRASDFFGFGYVLPALIATKILQRHGFFQVLVPIAMTSGTIFLAGSLLGFAFHVAEQMPPERTGPVVRTVIPEPASFWKSIMMSQAYIVPWPRIRNMNEDRQSLIDTRAKILAGRLMDLPTRMSCEQVMKGISGTLTCARHFDPQAGPFLVIHEQGRDAAATGFGVVIIRPRSKGPVLMADDLISNPALARALYRAGLATDARAIVMSGRDRAAANMAAASPNEDSGLLTRRVYHYTEEGETILIRMKKRAGTNDWHVRYRLPESFEISSLRDAFAPLSLRWDAPSDPPPQWVHGKSCFSVLELAPPENNSAQSLSPSPDHDLCVEDAILASFRYNQAHPAFVTPAWQQVTLLRRNVLSPILRAASQKNIPVPRIAALMAKLLGIKIIHHQDSDKDFIEARPAPGLGWGNLFVRKGNARQWLLIVPMPYTRHGTLETAAWWFEHFDVRAVFFTGTRFDANPREGTNALLTPLNTSVTGAVVRAFLDSYGNKADAMVIIVSGAQDWKLSGADCLVSTGDELMLDRQASGPVRELFAKLKKEHMSTRMFSGKAVEVSLQGAMNKVARMVRTVKSAAYVNIWLSSKVRRPIMDENHLSEVQRALKYMGIKTRHSIAPPWPYEPPAITAADYPAYLLSAFCGYKDMPALELLARTPGVRMSAVFSHRTRKLYIRADSPNIKRWCVMGAPGVRVRDSY